MKYPKQIYVQVQNIFTSDEWLQAGETAKELEDGKVAVYELKKIVTKKTEIKLA